jgi:hypothetical protein
VPQRSIVSAIPTGAHQRAASWPNLMQGAAAMQSAMNGDARAPFFLVAYRRTSEAAETRAFPPFGPRSSSSRVGGDLSERASKCQSALTERSRSMARRLPGPTQQRLCRSQRLCSDAQAGRRCTLHAPAPGWSWLNSNTRLAPP